MSNRGMTVADGVIDTLAASEAELLARVQSLEADVLAYRELAQQALHALADLTVRLDRRRVELTELRDEYRAFRARVLRAATGERAA